MRWVEALKIWNAEHNPGKWCVAKKGSPEYDAVKAIMNRDKPKKEEPKKEAKKFVIKKPEAEKPKEKRKTENDLMVDYITEEGGQEDIRRLERDYADYERGNIKTISTVINDYEEMLGKVMEMGVSRAFAEKEFREYSRDVVPKLQKALEERESKKAAPKEEKKDKTAEFIKALKMRKEQRERMLEEARENHKKRSAERRAAAKEQLRKYLEEMKKK